MKIAPEGTKLEAVNVDVAPKVVARVRASDSDVVEPDCGHKARGVPGRWYCLSCGKRFEINDELEAEEHASENPDHEFSWQCFAGTCAKLVAARSQ